MVYISWAYGQFHGIAEYCEFVKIFLNTFDACRDGKKGKEKFKGIWVFIGDSGKIQICDSIEEIRG